jgi:hypothetical protein
MKAGKIVMALRTRTTAALAGAAGAATLAAGLAVAFSGAASAATAAPQAATSCAATPSSCGYPDASTTGVPAGTTLRTVPGQVSSGTGWHYDPRGWVAVDGAGAVLSGLNIPYNINVTAPNVTIKDTRVTVSGQPGISIRHAANATIEDSAITGVNATTGRMLAGVKDMYGDAAGLAVLRDNISWAETGVQLESGLVQDTYIHNTGYLPGDHVNGVTSNGGFTALLTITHNTIFIDRSQTDAIGLFDDFGVQTNRVITGNLLAGGGYPIYGGQNPGTASPTHIQVTGNKIATIYYPKGGAYGPATAYNRTGTANTWTANTWDTTGQAILAP